MNKLPKDWRKRLASIKVLHRGAHEEEEGKFCVMEGVSYVLDQEHSDEPNGVHSELVAVAQLVNDCCYSTNRGRTRSLKPLIPKLALMDKDIVEPFRPKLTMIRRGHKIGRQGKFVRLVNKIYNSIKDKPEVK